MSAIKIHMLESIENQPCHVHTFSTIKHCRTCVPDPTYWTAEALEIWLENNPSKKRYTEMIP